MAVLSTNLVVDFPPDSKTTSEARKKYTAARCSVVTNEAIFAGACYKDFCVMTNCRSSQQDSCVNLDLRRQKVTAASPSPKMGTVTAYPFTVYLPRYACWRKYVQALTVQLRSCPHCTQAAQGLSPPKLQNARCTPTGKILISRDENPTSSKSSKGLGFSPCIGADTPDFISTSSSQVTLVDARDNVNQKSCKRLIDNGTVEQYEILSIDPNCPRHGKFSRTAWLRKQQQNSLEVKPVLNAEAGLSSTDLQIVLRPNDRQLYSEAQPSEATAVTGIDNLIHETDEDDILLDSDFMDFLQGPELNDMEKELLEKQTFWDACDAEPATDQNCEKSAGEENAKSSEQEVEKSMTLTMPNMANSNKDLCTAENGGCKVPLTDALMSSGNVLPSDWEKEQERLLSVEEPVHLKSPPPSCKEVAKDKEQKAPLNEQVAVVQEDRMQKVVVKKVDSKVGVWNLESPKAACAEALLDTVVVRQKNDLLPVVNLAVKAVEPKPPFAIKTEIQSSAIPYSVNKKVECDPPPSIAFGLQHIRNDKTLGESVKPKGPTHTVVLRREIVPSPNGKFVTKVVESKVPLQDTPACQPHIVAETDRKRRIQIHEVPLNGTVSLLKREFENVLAEKVENNTNDRKISLSETPLQNRVGDMGIVANVMVEKQPSRVTTLFTRDDKVMVSDKAVSKVAERQEPSMETTLPRLDREPPKVSKEIKRNGESRTDIPLFTPEGEVLTNNKVVSKVVEKKEPTPETASYKHEREPLNVTKDVNEKVGCKDLPPCATLLKRESEVPSRVVKRKEPLIETNFLRREGAPLTLEKIRPQKIENRSPLRETTTIKREGDILGMGKGVNKKSENKMPVPKTNSAWMEHEPPGVGKCFNKRMDIKAPVHEKSLLEKQAELLRDDIMNKKEKLMELSTEITEVKAKTKSSHIQISVDNKGENTAVVDALLPERHSMIVSQGDTTVWKPALRAIKPEESLSLETVVMKKVGQKALQTLETQNNLVTLKIVENTCLELERTPPEKVCLRQGEVVQRKEAAEWMLDNAMEGALNKLGNDGKRVRTLVEAFESIMNLSDPSEKLKEGEKFLAEVKYKSTLQEGRLDAGCL